MPEGRDPQPGIETLNGLPRKCEEPDDEAKQLLLDWWSQQGLCPPLLPRANHYVTPIVA